MIGEIGYSPRNGTLGECVTATPRREPEIGVELARLNESVDYLEKSLSDLYQRISPVMRTEPQTDNVKERADEHRSSTIGSALQQIRQRMQRLTSNVNAVTSLVEL